jgi:hypothetical protein
MCLRVYFGSLAGGTTVDVVMDKLRHSRPPEFSRNNFVGLPSFWVTCGDVVVVLFDNVSSKVVIFWNVDMSTVEDKSVFKVPIF